MDTIRESVRAKYAETAIKLRDRGSCCDSSCCGGSDAISGPIGEEEYSKAEIAESAVFLCSDSAAYITGTILDCDGGSQLGDTR